VTSPCSLHESITLPDGRLLAYADIGDPVAHPVFYFHGFPGSRIEAQFSRDIVREVGARVISVERPGYGQSCFAPERKITDWSGDVVALADALGIERFSILGVSTGGVYALACATQIPERLLSVGIACTPAPADAHAIRREMDWVSRLGFYLSQRHSKLGELVLGRFLGFVLRHWTAFFLKLITIGGPVSDRLALDDPNFRDAVLASLREAYRAGHRGPFYDLHLVSREWDFELQEVQLPVHLWHGQHDTVVPVAMGQYLAEHFKDCHAHYPEGEGHFSLTVNYMEHALRTLKQQAG
jgi:pimeloyl-ACP methyl ester carboxylesterase